MRKLRNYVLQDAHVHQGEAPAGRDEKVQEDKVSTMTADKANVVVNRAYITSVECRPGCTVWLV